MKVLIFVIKTKPYKNLMFTIFPFIYIQKEINKQVYD